MNLLKSYPLALLCSLAIVSCVPANLDVVGDPNLSTNRTDIVFAPDSETGKLIDTVLVSCNRSWSSVIEYAGTDPKDSPWLQLSVTEDVNYSGYEHVVKVVVKADATLFAETRKAELVFWSEGKSTRIPISQPRYIPKVSIDKVATPSTLLPTSEEVKIVFASNDAWTAELSEVTPGYDVTLSATSGSRETNTITLIMGKNINTESSKSAKVTLKTGNSEDFIVVSQKSWYMIEALFSNGTSILSSWPFLYPGTSDIGTSTSNKKLKAQRIECTMRSGAESFYVQSKGGLWKNSKQGFDFTCEEDADGLELPSVKNKKLAAVELVTGYTKSGVTTQITGSDNVAIAGGEGYEFKAAGESHTWYPVNEMPEAVRKLRAATVMIREIRVYYEQ